ncbi:hypothetical protein [Brevibacillus sp. SYSU BS000544]|uniref:hypothetical protein n=1 Tax=Brevibacillus sp. SYSU BS000544 TaxID=3416443 RepID=UPI003CE48795
MSSSIRRTLENIGIGTNIRIHFDGQSHEGTFIGVNNGVAAINRAGVPGQTVFVPINKITAIDIPVQ